MMTIKSALRSKLLGTVAGTLLASFAGIATLGTPFSPAMARGITSEGFADLVQQLQPAVVNVSTTTKVEVGRTVQMFEGLPPGHPLEEFFRRQQPPQGRKGGKGSPPSDGGSDESQPITREARSLGSGFVIDASGLVVTNNHVITGEDLDTMVDSIKVTFPDGTEYDAKLIGRDKPADLALLKIDTKGKAVPFVKFGDSNKARVGDAVLAIGNPFGLGGSVTSGIVSALHRGVQGASPYDYFIQTDASINRGNSGGPMFNTSGEVIGINSAIYSPSGGNVGIGFAIPSTYASSVIGQLRNGGKVHRAWLGVGIQPLSDDVAEAQGLQNTRGAIVNKVEPGTPASKAGVKAGDIITTFDGSPIPTYSTLPLLVSQTPIGKTVDLQILRGGKPMNLRITVAELPGGDIEKIGVAPDAEEPKDKKENKSARQSLGLTLTPLTPELRQRLKLDAGTPAVVISEINPSSDAAQKGLQPGDAIIEINGLAVGSVDAAARQVDLARNAKKSSVLMRMYRQGVYFFVGVKLQPLK